MLSMAIFGISHGCLNVADGIHDGYCVEVSWLIVLLY